jgi:hypothetical protein
MQSASLRRKCQLGQGGDSEPSLRRSSVDDVVAASLQLYTDSVVLEEMCPYQSRDKLVWSETTPARG